MCKNAISIFLLSFFFCIACSSSGEKTTDGGLLWKISGNGLEKPSYLFGTWHGTSDILYGYVDSIPGYHAAFDACTQCIGEVNLSETNSNFVASMKMPADTTYADLLGEGDYQFLDSVTRHFINAPLNKVYLKPVLLSVILQQTEERETLKQAGYSQSQVDSISSQVMDIVIHNKAKEKNYALGGLETIQQQMELISGPGSMKEQAVQSVAALRLQRDEKYKARIDSMKNRLVRAYRSQNIQDIADYEVYADSIFRKIFTEPATYNPSYLQDTLIIQRNIDWSEKIPAMIGEQPSFIAVGVRHLPGEKGVISLLRKKGYQVEAVK